MTECPLLALSGHASAEGECPLSGVERTDFRGKIGLCLWHSCLSKIFVAASGRKSRRVNSGVNKQRCAECETRLREIAAELARECGLDDDGDDNQESV